MEQTGEQEEVTQEPGLPLGIDFGNSKISGAVWDQNKKAPVMVEYDKMTQFPATLYCSGIFDKKESVPNEGSGEENDLCPEIGLDYSQEKETKYYIYDIKKLIGQKNTNQDLENIINEIRYPNSVDDEGNIVCFEEEKVPFQKLAKYFIEKIKTAAEAQFEKEINFCTISVPHGFNYNQRTAIQEAANLANIKNVFIINDPLSTAIYYASRNKIQKNENFLIIDFGSSKLDINILTISKKNSIQIKFSGGDEYLGGNIYNKELINDIIETYRSDGGTMPENEAKRIELEQVAEKIKRELTFKLESSIIIEKFDGNKDLVYSIKRENFDDLVREENTKIIKLINNVIKESNIPIEDIQHIILQGDALRVVSLKNLIKKQYSNCDIIEDLYDSIAYGSAIYTAKQLDMLNNNQFKNFKVYDITPISLGIRGEGDLMSVILPRGSRIPIKVMKYYVTTQDNQTNVKFEIFAGERKLTKDNELLDKIILKKLPQMNKGQIKIEVIFEVNENFILHVSAREASSNIIKETNVAINEELSQNQIMERVHEAKKFEKEDLDERERILAMLRLNDKIFEFSHLYEGNEDILRELESYRNWIKHSTTVPKIEYENKLQELNKAMIIDVRESKNKRMNGNNNFKRTNKSEEEKNSEMK